MEGSSGVHAVSYNSIESASSRFSGESLPERSGVTEISRGGESFLRHEDFDADYWKDVDITGDLGHPEEVESNPALRNVLLERQNVMKNCRSVSRLLAMEVGQGRLDESAFVDYVHEGQVEESLAHVRDREKEFGKDYHSVLSDAFEKTIAYFGGDLDLLGAQRTRRASRFDDIANKVDIIADFQNGDEETVAKAVLDLTSATDSLVVSRKLSHAHGKIMGVEKNFLRFDYTEDEGPQVFDRNVIPLVVGVDQHKAAALVADFAGYLRAKHEGVGDTHYFMERISSSEARTAFLYEIEAQVTAAEHSLRLKRIPDGDLLRRLDAIRENVDLAFGPGPRPPVPNDRVCYDILHSCTSHRSHLRRANYYSM